LLIEPHLQSVWSLVWSTHRLASLFPTAAGASVAAGQAVLRVLVDAYATLRQLDRLLGIFLKGVPAEPGAVAPLPLHEISPPGHLAAALTSVPALQLPRVWETILGHVAAASSAVRQVAVHTLIHFLRHAAVVEQNAAALMRLCHRTQTALSVPSMLAVMRGETPAVSLNAALDVFQAVLDINVRCDVWLCNGHEKFFRPPEGFFAPLAEAAGATAEGQEQQQQQRPDAVDEAGAVDFRSVKVMEVAERTVSAEARLAFSRRLKEAPTPSRRARIAEFLDSCLAVTRLALQRIVQLHDFLLGSVTEVPRAFRKELKQLAAFVTSPFTDVEAEAEAVLPSWWVDAETDGNGGDDDRGVGAARSQHWRLVTASLDAVAPYTAPAVRRWVFRRLASSASARLGDSAERQGEVAEASLECLRSAPFYEIAALRDAAVPALLDVLSELASDAALEPLGANQAELPTDLADALAKRLRKANKRGLLSGTVMDEQAAAPVSDDACRLNRLRGALYLIRDLPLGYVPAAHRSALMLALAEVELSSDASSTAVRLDARQAFVEVLEAQVHAVLAASNIAAVRARDCAETLGARRIVLLPDDGRVLCPQNDILLRGDLLTWLLSSPVRCAGRAKGRRGHG
jgi:hypothetical protein